MYTHVYVYIACIHVNVYMRIFIIMHVWKVDKSINVVVTATYSGVDFEV